MIKDIMHDEKFLSQKAEAATKDDIPVGKDLVDTLQAYKYRCVGMAANMIGVNKAIIAVELERMPAAILMFNPKLVKKSAKSQKVTERCLSVAGEHEAIRYESIEVTYRDVNWNKKKEKFSGWTAQIIQHELDHLAGILV